MLRPALTCVVIVVVGITSLPNLAAVASGNPYLLPKGFFGLDLDPYLNEPLQWPGQPGRLPLSEAQIWGRLERIAPYTRRVRSYAVSDGLDQIPPLARTLGLRTQIGTWIVDYGGNEDDAEIQRAFEVASPGDVSLAGDIVVIGNEEIYNHPWDPSHRRNWPELRDYILNTVIPLRDGLGKGAVPISIAEPWSTLFDTSGVLKPEYDGLFDTIDGPLLVNIHPYNEGIPSAEAFDYLKEVYSNITLMNPDKHIWIGETGWPSDGGADASPEKAASYLRECLAWMDDEQVPLMYFMAYDVAWKVDVFSAPAFEAHLGVWYNDGILKIPGDYNRDGVVDAADYTVWRDMLGQSGSGLVADGDGSGTVGEEDYAIWRENFGMGWASGDLTTGLSAVPEPTTLLMFELAILTALCRRRSAVS